MQYLLILLISCSSERVQTDKLEGIGRLMVCQNGEKLFKLSKSIFDHYQFNIQKDSKEVFMN